MEILAYLKSLQPVMDRRDVIQTLDILKDEIDEVFLPMLNDIGDVLKTVTFTGTQFRLFQRQLSAYVKYNGNPFNLVIESIETLSQNITVLEAEIKKAFNDKIASDNLTYQGVNLLQYVEAAVFYVRFARKLIIAVVTEEAVQAGGTPAVGGKAAKEFIDTRLNEFCALVPAMLKTSSELKQINREVSGAVVNEETHALAMQSLGIRKTDPMGFTPQKNILMTLGRMFVEWQVNNLRASKEDRAVIQLRIQELESLKAGGNVSPKLQSQITSLEDQVQRLDYKIAKLEEEYSYDA